MALGQAGIAAISLAVPGILAFIFAVVAENRKPEGPAHAPRLTYDPTADQTTCNYPTDPTIALGILSVVFLFMSALLAVISFYFPYNGTKVSPSILWRSTTLLVFTILSLCFIVWWSPSIWMKVVLCFRSKWSSSGVEKQTTHSWKSLLAHAFVVSYIWSSAIQGRLLLMIVRYSWSSATHDRLPLMVIWAIFLLSEGLLTWAIAVEYHHRKNNVHSGQIAECETAKTGLFGGAGFLALDATLFFLLALMLTTNARSDYLLANEEDDKGSYGEVTMYPTPTGVHTAERV